MGLWANSVDPDRTTPVWSGSALFAIPSASFGLISLWLSHSVQILGQLQQRLRCPNIWENYDKSLEKNRSPTK